MLCDKCEHYKVKIVNNIPTFICEIKGKKPLYEVVKCPNFTPRTRSMKRKHRIRRERAGVNQQLLTKWLGVSHE